jgi:formate hydrogenlyase subunit 4
MSLKNREWDIILFVYFISMLDVLATMAGIRTKSGYEGNPFISWITPQNMMFFVMVITNVLFVVGVTVLFNYINKSQKEELYKKDYGKILSSSLFSLSCVRFIVGPFLWLIVMCGFPHWW